jgi:hypothetical protein
MATNKIPVSINDILTSYNSFYIIKVPSLKKSEMMPTASIRQAGAQAS